MKIKQQNVKEEEMKKVKKIKGKESVIFVLLLCVFYTSIGAAFHLYYIGLKNRCTYKTTAVVSGIIVSNSNKPGKIQKTPVFTYEYNGKEYSSKGNLSSSSGVFVEGRKVELFINPEKTKELFYPKGNINKLLMAFYSSGSILLIIAIFNFTRNKRLYKYAENKRKADELIFGDMDKE